VEFAQTNASHPWLPTRRYGITQGYQSVVLFGGELPDTDGRELPGSADLPSERCSLVLVGEMGAGRHEALLYSPTGDHVYKVLYGRFGLRLGNLFVVKVLEDPKRFTLSTERGSWMLEASGVGSIGQALDLLFHEPSIVGVAERGRFVYGRV